MRQVGSTLAGSPGPCWGSAGRGWRPETTCRGPWVRAGGREAGLPPPHPGRRLSSQCLCSHLAGPEKLGISRSISSGTPREESSPRCRGSLPPHRSSRCFRASQEGSCNLEGGSWLSERGPAESQRAPAERREAGKGAHMDLAHGQPAASLRPWWPTPEEACPCPAYWSRPLTVPLALWGMGLSAPGIRAAPGGAILPLPGGRAGQSGTETPGAWGSRLLPTWRPSRQMIQLDRP